MNDFLNSDEFFLFVIPGAGIFLFVLLLVLIFKPRRKKVRTVQSEVLTKKIKRAYIKSVAAARVSGMDWLEYYAVFRTEKGKKVELQLPKEIYDGIEEGDKGQLTFDKDRFISFDKNSAYFV